MSHFSNTLLISCSFPASTNCSKSFGSVFLFAIVPFSFPNSELYQNSFYVLLYHFVGHSFFGLIFFGSFSDIIKRNFSLTLAKLNFYVDMSVWLFVGKQYYRLDVSIKLKHIPTKSRKYKQYFYSTNTVYASPFPQIHN